jgi:hypothetical protein
MKPVMTAPDEEIPPALLFVFDVAETSVAPHDFPVVVSNPLASTVNICVVLDAQVTSLVMSLVTGG